MSSTLRLCACELGKGEPRLEYDNGPGGPPLASVYYLSDLGETSSHSDLKLSKCVDELKQRNFEFVCSSNDRYAIALDPARLVVESAAQTQERISFLAKDRITGATASFFMDLPENRWRSSGQLMSLPRCELEIIPEYAGDRFWGHIETHGVSSGSSSLENNSFFRRMRLFFNLVFQPRYSDPEFRLDRESSTSEQTYVDITFTPIPPLYQRIYTWFLSCFGFDPSPAEIN
jgi:hypothetical protein